MVFSETASVRMMIGGTMAMKPLGTHSIASLKPNIHIRGFISNVSVLMDSADLFLTKPGGISTTEAMVKGLPMVLVNVVGGCETPNLNFFVSHGGAATAGTQEDIAALCKELLENDEERLIMRQSLLSMKQIPAAQAICDRLEG